MGIRINPVSWQVFYADNFAIFLSMKRNIFPGGHAEPSKYGPYAMYLFEFNKYLFKTEFGMVIAYIQSLQNGDNIPIQFFCIKSIKMSFKDLIMEDSIQF